jgi:hypothetical protein
MKQTAVDYLFEKLWQMPKDKLVWQHYLEKAKDMEKHQIIKAYDEGICEGFDYGYHKDNPNEESGLEYYIYTYENES